MLILDQYLSLKYEGRARSGNPQTKCPFSIIYLGYSDSPVWTVFIFDGCHRMLAPQI